MATILKFEREREADSGKAKRRAGQSAEIIIFPGARYERWEQSNSNSRGRGQVERDVLILAD